LPPGALVIAAEGNVLGVPATIALDLAGLPSATRDGHLRAAISALIATATARGARAIIIENLNFANTGLSVIVIDPAYTSRWGAEHRLRPLRKHHPEATGHHAAALVIGRRGLGHRARRRATGTRTTPEEAARPAQTQPRTTPAHRNPPRKPAAPPGPRQPPGSKTGRPHRTAAGDQAAQDRSGPPPRQAHVLLAH